MRISYRQKEIWVALPAQSQYPGAKIGSNKNILILRKTKFFQFFSLNPESSMATPKSESFFLNVRSRELNGFKGFPISGLNKLI